MTALETLALGVPLVAHDVGGLQAILADYPELKVTKHHPQAYADCLIQLRARPTPLQLALSPVYDARDNAQKTLALYRKLREGL